MKILNLIAALFFIGITTTFGQNNKENGSINSKNAKTETVEANGIQFSYRKFGNANGSVPVVFVNHLAGVLDDWDPRILDAIAAKHEIIIFDNRGVGTTEGVTPKTVEEMADDAIAFIHSLGYKKIDLLGFSLGGAVSQLITLKEPQLVRKLILAGTGQAGSVGADKITGIAYKNQIKSMLTFKDVRTYLFFTSTKNGKKQAKDFIKRVIGIPGDTIELVDGYIYLNGKKLDESTYLSSDVRTYGGAFIKDGQPFTVPAGNYPGLALHSSRP